MTVRGKEVKLLLSETKAFCLTAERLYFLPKRREGGCDGHKKKSGRIDLYGRLHADRVSMSREVHRLTGRIPRTGLHYNDKVVENLNELTVKEELNYPAIVWEIERILEE